MKKLIILSILLGVATIAYFGTRHADRLGYPICFTPDEQKAARVYNQAGMKFFDYSFHDEKFFCQ